MNIKSKKNINYYTIKNFLNDIENNGLSEVTAGDFKCKLMANITCPIGSMSAIGGRPGRGKTTALVNIARQAVDENRKVLFISLEMNKKQIFHKLVLSFMYNRNKDSRQVLEELNDPQKQPLEEFYYKIKQRENSKYTYYNIFYEYLIKKSDLFNFYFARGNSFTTIVNIIKSQDAHTLILLDYIQRIPSINYRDDGYMRLKKILDGLISAVEYSKTVLICGAQLNRSGTKIDNNITRDYFDDGSFRESGDIEQDAHNAIGIGYWCREENKRYIKILKEREDGNTDKEFKLKFEGKFSYMELGEQINNIDKKKYVTKQKKMKFKYENFISRHLNEK
jgi:hypothetical protein